MEFRVDMRQPVTRTVSSLEPSHLWVLGLAPDDENSIVEVGGRPYSYLAECECPENCQRDHENE